MHPSDSVRVLLGERITAAKRHSLPKSEFGVPEKEGYPVDTRKRAANALSRSSGKPVAGRVKAKACAAFPSLPSCKEAVDALLGEV